MYGYIYETTNLINNKKYIGQHRSETFDESYAGSGILLLKAIQKYGKENFSTRILQECESDSELNELEKYYIKLFDAVNSNEYYNIANGGEGHACEPWNKGLKGVQEVTPKMLNALEKGRHLPSSDKQKEVLRNNRINFVASDETRLKCAIAGAKANKNKKIMNNGIIHKYISEQDVPKYLSDGWVFGKVIKKSQ